MCTDVHASLGWWAGRPGGRPSREFCSLEMAPVNRPVDLCSLYPAPVDWTVDRPESRCSLVPGPVDQAVDRWHNDHKNDRWLVDRAIDRKVISDHSWLPTGRIVWGYKYPTFEVVLYKFSRAKIPIFLSVLTTSFKRIFGFKRSIFICF